MTVRVMLVPPPVRDDVRFGADEPVGPVDAQAPGAQRYFAGPSQRCRSTAQGLGIAAVAEAALADLDVGEWRGRTLDEVAAEDPAAVARWLGDPATTPHGGESVVALCARVGDWLERSAEDGGRVLAVVEPAVVRAAVVHALRLPPEVFWRLDVRPLTVTELSGRAGRWNLVCGAPLAG